MLTLMRAKGFGSRWIEWMEAILSSGTSSVLLNGSPGKRFHCKRGVRQGDPLSPLLFVLVADFLQSMINSAKDSGLLNLPIPTRCTNDFPVIQYADDTLIITEGYPRQLFFLKSLLNNFSLSTGLRVNFSKSMMVRVNVPTDKTTILAGTFGCSIGSLPFSYLGLPLCISRPRFQDFMPMISKCEKKLAFISPFLNQAGRLEMVNAVLSAMPTFFMCSIILPKAVIKQIDKFRKHCLWRGSSINEKGSPKAAWNIICVPKDQGGLGVIDLEKQNKALIIKNLHKFFNKYNLPWVHLVWEKHYSNNKLPSHIVKGFFWWRDILKLLPKFKEIAKPIFNNGSTILFWYDPWLDTPIVERYPEMFSFARNKHLSATKAVEASDLTTLVHLPLSEQAFSQLESLLEDIQSISPNDEQDKWFTGGTTGSYSSNRIYRMLIGSNNGHIIYKWIWRNRTQPKHRVFIWLLLKDRLNTKNILKRKNMVLSSYTCALCSFLVEETAQHLFLDCDFARMCWNMIGLDIPLNTSIEDMIMVLKAQINPPFFMETIILMSWTIWTARNELIFRGIGFNYDLCGRAFFKELKLLLFRVQQGQHHNLEQWIQTLQLIAA